MEKEVHELIKRAVKAGGNQGDEAMCLSQAALNCANALRALNDIEVANLGRKPPVDT
jgi:hypothetical protein